MVALLPKAQASPTQGPVHGVRSFADLARLVQRTLDCDAVVLSFNSPAAGTPSPQVNEAGSARSTIAAYREGKQASIRIDAGALTHPVSAGAQGMRFYAGLPLRDHLGQPIGTLAAADRSERQLAGAELDRLRHLARMAADIEAVQRISFAA